MVHQRKSMKEDADTDTDAAFYLDKAVLELPVVFEDPQTGKPVTQDFECICTVVNKKPVNIAYATTDPEKAMKLFLFLEENNMNDEVPEPSG